MANGERSGSGGPSDWRVRLAAGVGLGAGAAVARRPARHGVEQSVQRLGLRAGGHDECTG
jgi:hypothetical protein